MVSQHMEVAQVVLCLQVGVQEQTVEATAATASAHMSLGELLGDTLVEVAKVTPRTLTSSGGLREGLTGL